ncbi:uncharacterized protein LOC119392842 [Rhipicephalus sanguineus]|uniref:uncharacterized protein LOC119392842 n=1 Tax=Rhipicephalus sanguineus TaxID=34632 RepID=UPI0020C582A3|nr:uncharacterized protein LOC119392842 [Rhipicephalus sanguineus]
MSEDTEPSSEDSSSFEGAHARYQPNAWAHLGKTLQVGVRPMIPYGPLQTATFVGAASEGAGPSGATPLRALSPPPMFNKSTERTIAATEALAWQTPVPQPSRRPGDSLVDRAEAADVSQATKTGSTHAILADESSPGEVPQGGALQASKISRRFTKDQSLERLLGLHARRETLHQRAEAPRRVHIPLDLVEFVEERCCFMLMADGEDANRDATDETDEFEGMVHLFEWESFTRTLLNVHSCIRWFSLSISAVSKLPTRFYLGFDLRDGTALLTVEVAAYADPWMDLMLPYLRYLRQILNSQQVEIDLGDMSPRNHDGTIFDDNLLDGPAEFNDSRLAQILEAAIEMPRLKTFCVDLLNTGAGPLHEIDIRLWLTQNTSGVPRNRQYEVDAIYKDLLDCESTNTSTAGETNETAQQLSSSTQFNGGPLLSNGYKARTLQSPVIHRSLTTQEDNTAGAAAGDQSTDDQCGGLGSTEYSPASSFIGTPYGKAEASSSPESQTTQRSSENIAAVEEASKTYLSMIKDDMAKVRPLLHRITAHRQLDPTSSGGAGYFGEVTSCAGLSRSPSTMITITESAEVTIAANGTPALQNVTPQCSNISKLQGPSSTKTANTPLNDTKQDPCLDFVVPHLRYLRQVQNPQATDIFIEDMDIQRHENVHYRVYSDEILRDGAPELIDNRLAGILEATADMPSLQDIVIFLHNTGPASGHPGEITVRFTHLGFSDEQRLRRQIDAYSTNYLYCKRGANVGADTRDVDSGQAVEDSSPSSMLANEPSNGGTPQAAAIGVATNARARNVDDSLQRLVGLHSRRTRVRQPDESTRVRTPPDLEDVYEGPCNYRLQVAGHQGPNTAPAACEETNHLAEWETFTSALLSVHPCIHRMDLRISAVARPPGHFYQSFSLRSCWALIEVEVAAFSNPFLDFVLPCLSYMCGLRNYELSQREVQNIFWQHHPGITFQAYCDLLRSQALQCQDKRLARLLQVIMDIPFLRQFVVNLISPDAGQREPRKILLRLPRHDAREQQKLRYEIDDEHCHFLQCKSSTLCRHQNYIYSWRSCAPQIMCPS